MRLSVLFTGNNRDLKRATREGRSELNKFKTTAVNVAGTLAGAYGAATTARAIFDTTKEVERLSSQLAVAMGGMEAGSRKFDQLNRFASDIGANVQEVTRAFVQLRNVGLNPSEDAILSYMNTAGATGKSLEQFVEAVADATMGQFERLNEFGIKAQKEGDKIAIRFRGTTQLVENNARAIEQYMTALGQNEFGGYIENQLGGVNDALAKFNNQWIESVRTLEKGGLGETIADGINVATDALAGLTEFVDENGDQIIDVGKAIAAVFAARIAGSVGSASLAFVAHMAYQQQVTARYARMNGMAAITATRMRAVGTAARFASRGMAMLGGPVGIAALAAMAIYEFSSEAEAATAPTDKLKGSVDGLAQSFEGLTEAQLRNKYESATRNAFVALPADIRRVKGEISELEEKLDDWGFKLSHEGAMADIELANLEKQLQRLIKEQAVAEDTVAKLGTKLAELGEKSDDAGESVDNLNESIKKQAEEYAKVTLSLTDQIYKLQEGEAAYERLTMARQMGVSLDSLEMENLEKLIALRDRLVQKKEDELEAERKRQNMQNSLGSLTQQLMPGVSEVNQHADNMGFLKSAKKDPSLMPTMQVEDGQGGFREESIVEKRMRINQMLELEQQRHMGEMARINGEMSAQIDAMWSETFDRFAAGIGDAVATSIMEGKDFGEVMENLARSTLKTFISTFVEIGVKRLALASLEKSAAASTASANISAISATTAASTAATATTTATQTAAAGTVAAAWTPAAIWASIGSFGQAAVLAGGAILAVKALGGFRKGGYTGNYGENDVAGVVHGREFVFDAKSTSAIGVKNLENMMASASGPSIIGMAHDGLNRVPMGNEGTYLLKRGEMVLNPEQRENFEKVVNAVRNQRSQGGGIGGKGATKVEIIQTNHFEMNGSAGDDREGVEEALNRANEQMKQELYDDFSNGGPLYQRLKASG
jgi:hypothetical protein